MLVLVVDDDPDFRALLAKGLRAAGHDVEMRESAFGLVNRVAGFDTAGAAVGKPDVVVLDHMLPGLPGADSLDLLASSSRTSDVPVVLVSNGFADELRERAKEHALCRFVPKTGRILPLVEEITAFARSVERTQELAS